MRALWLIGMMGSGKTVAGEIVAQRLDLPFVDTDERIATKQGQAITSLWEATGEGRFRQLESEEIVKLVDSGRDCVVAAGGGAVLMPANVTAMRDHGLVVWLTAEPEVLATRLDDDLTRPLLAAGSIGDRLTGILRDRQPVYAAAAHHAVDTTDMTPRDVAREVVLLWNAS